MASDVAHRLSCEQALAWRMERHRLVERAAPSDLRRVVGGICGWHAQLMSSAELSLWARIDGLERGAVHETRWKRRALVKLWAMRGTLHQYLTGWRAYFRLAETPLVFRKLDEWLRHRMRQWYLQQWNRGRTIYRELRARGASDALARMVASGSKRGWYHAAHTIHVVVTNAHFDRLGLPRLAS
jgi:hypothetical protein